MNTSRLVLALALAVNAAAAGAQMPAFAYERGVDVDSAGVHHLALDATILAGGAPFRVTSSNALPGGAVALDGLNDLRLYDANAKEVPYLFVYPRIGAAPRTNARAIPITPAKKTSGFEVDLGTARPVDLLQVIGLPAPFMKRAQLEGSGDRARWTLLVAEGTLFDLPADRMRQTELEFLPGNYRYLRLTWDDSTSGRMPLPSAVLVRAATSLAAPPKPLVVPVPAERRPAEPGKSRYVLHLPGAHLPIVALRLTVGDSNVFRAAKVTEARLVGMDVQPVALGAATLRRAVRGGLVASALEIPITPPMEDRLELSIDDANNPPLAITGVEAVFAELPYIFFQGTGGALTARYGAPTLPAPRYDLAALADSAAALPFAMAHWGAVTRLTPAADASAGAGVPTSGAPIDVRSFRYSRPITDTTAGLATLRLDAAVLAHSKLSDIRIVDASGAQVPYLLEHLDGPLADSLTPLERIPRADSAGRRNESRYRLRLPYDRLWGARLVLRTPARVFERQVRVEMLSAGDPRNAPRMVAYGNASWAHADPDTPAPALTFSIPEIARDSAEIVIDEGDNTPLPMEAPVLLLPGYQLRFLGDGKPGLQLLYGHRDLTPPRYDIALLAPRLVGVPATEIAMGAEGPARELATNTLPGRVFWGVLIAAVLIMLVIVARLVKAGAPAEAAN